MSLPALNWAEAQRVGSSSAKAVLFVLAKYADDKGVCWPSQETIAKAMELSMDTVQRGSARLEKIGLLTRERRKSSGGRWPAFTYRLLLNVNVDHAAACGEVKANDQAAMRSLAEPQSARPPSRTARHKSSIESSIESSLGSSGSEHLLGNAGARLKKRLGEKLYFAWFREVELVEAADDTVVLSVRLKFQKTYIEGNYAGQLLDCFRPDYPKVVRVQLVVRPGSE